jgi:methylated-DNA-[protein]-cysteine S-methyltransferase
MNPFDLALRRLDERLRPPRLPIGDVSYALHDTGLGQLVLAVAEPGTVVACSYDDEAAVTEHLARALSPRVLRRPDRLDTLRRQLDEYLEGRRRSIDLPTSTVLATPFTQNVLEVLRSVPYGSTTSYGDVARAIGEPQASRAVGNALGANPICIVLPCHRVVRGDGSLGGYAGGAEAKHFLLELERGS